MRGRVHLFVPPLDKVGEREMGGSGRSQILFRIGVREHTQHNLHPQLFSLPRFLPKDQEVVKVTAEFF